MPNPVIQLTDVTKRFVGHTAVRELSLRVPRGAVYGLLGPNGAGKTTSLRMILSIVLPDEGEVRLFDGTAGGREQSHRIGYLPEERGLYRKMKVDALLVFLAEIKGVRRAEAKRQSAVWLERLGLGAWGKRKVEELSKGMQQKVQFISTMLHRPELLVLDEPFAGLDPVNAQLMKDIVLEQARAGTTVLFSTHIMEQAEKMCDAVCILAQGRKVVDGALSDIKRQHGGKHLTVALEEGSVDIDDIFNKSPIVARHDNYGLYAEVELTEEADPQQLLEVLVQAKARITRFEVAEPSLHKIYLDKVGGTPASAEEKAEIAGV